MRSTARCAALLCLWVSVTALKDMRSIFDEITNEVITGTYTARVEVTRESGDEKNTYTLIEYHDSSSGQHSIEMTSHNTRKFFYENLGSGKVATVDADGKCKVLDVGDAAMETEAFIYKSNDPIKPRYFLGPSTVFVEFLADSFNWTYLNDEVRGIKAKMYSNSMKKGSKRWINIWFADGDEWDIKRISANGVPFPLRVLIEENGATDQFEFYQVEDLSPGDAFRLGDNLLLPFGSECKLPSSIEEPLSLLSTFSFTSAVGQSVAKEYFSIENQLYRADQADGRTVIHDDTYGLIYTLESGCQAQPNPDVDHLILSMGSTNPGARIVQAYLSLPNKTYIGEGSVRGVPVDVWDAAGDGIVRKARFFFSKSNAVSSANGDRGSQQLMKAMVLDSLEHDQTLDVDIYDFASSLGDLEFRENFNIEDCVDASTYVEIGFQATKTFNIEELKLSNALHELIDLIEENIQGTIRISSLQLPAFKAEVVDGNRIKVFVKILAPPPYLNSFTMRRAQFKHYKGIAGDPTMEGCARQCLENEGVSCQTFLFCGKSTCLLMSSKNETKWGEPIPLQPADCEAYDRVPTGGLARKTLEETSEELKKSAMWLWPPLKVWISGDQSVTLSVIEFRDHLTQFNKQGTLGPYTLQYPKTSIRDDHPASFLIEKDVLTAGQCYRECRNNGDIACSSFSICTTNKRCVLSSENINMGTRTPADQPDVIMSSTKDCSLYSVNYLSEFERTEGKTRKSGSMENSAASSAGDCAVICRQQDLLSLEDCRSFDFCSEQKRCFFYRTHYGWDGGEDALTDKKGCDHYALRYSASYIAVAKGVFLGKPVTKVSAIKFEECAKQCSERSNEECKTISYCDSDIPDKEKETCYMYAANVENLFDNNNQESTCTVYTKDEAINDEVINPTRQIEKERRSHQIGMGDGGFAFLLIAMIAVGAVLGAVGWFHREKFPSLVRRSGGVSLSETTISYNRQDDENRAEA